MSRVQLTLTAPTGYTLEEVSLAMVNEWMIELRPMPYRYSRLWKTPFEVEQARVADCKGKAITLYDRLELNGATNVRLVIGKRRASDTLTHAWVEWETKATTYVLDPTFNWVAERKSTDRSRYVTFYAYEGPCKYQTSDSALVQRSLGAHTPVAPSQGVISTPVRSKVKSPPNRTSSREIPFELRMLASRSEWHG